MDQANHFDGFPLWLGAMLAGELKAPAVYLLTGRPTPAELIEVSRWAQLVIHTGLRVKYQKKPPRFVVSRHKLDPNPPPFLEQFPIPLIR